MKELKRSLWGVVGVLLLTACTYAPIPTSTPPDAGTPSPTVPSGRAEDVVPGLAARLVGALSDRDMTALAPVVHPTKGVRFSPYAYVRQQDLVFGAPLLDALLADETRYLWGVYDGSGEPIELAFADYYEESVYDQDFANAEAVAYDEVLGRGNTTNNIREFYPHGVSVEYHFSGFDPQYAGMDWVSLRLVFEEWDGAWYLVGLVHDEWTI
jgi:hypothetical protein